MAGSWTPIPRLRLTAELMRLEYERGQRAYAGLSPHVVELQGRLVARVLF